MCLAMMRQLVIPSPNNLRPLFSERQQVQRLQKDEALAEAAAYTVKARGSSTWTTSDLHTATRNVVETVRAQRRRVFERL